MSNILEIIIKAIDQASQTFDTISQKGMGMSKEMEAAFMKTGIALTGVGVGAKLAVDNINQSFLNFDQAMTEVKGLGVVGEELDSLRTKALDISKTMPVAADDVAKAMYLMVSTGWDYNDMMAAIEPTTKLAVAGSVEMADATNAVINAMAAYKDAGLTADQATAIFAKGVGVGKWELNDFMTEMMKNINVASGLGISFQELAAYNVALQNSFTDASEAGSALKMMLMNLVEEKNIKKLADMGVQVKDSQGNFRGLIPIMTDLDKALDAHGGTVDRATVLTELFGARSVNAAEALMRQKDELPDLIKQMGDASFIEEQFGAKVESAGAQLEIAKNKMEAAKIALGDAMAPATVAAADAMSGLAGVIEGLPGPLQTAAGTALTAAKSLILIGPAMMGVPFALKAIGPAAAVAGGVMKGLSLAISGVSVGTTGALSSFAAFGTALGGLIIPIGIAIAAAAALYLAWQTNFMGIRDIVGGAVDWMKERFAGMKDALEPVKDALGKLGDKLGEAFGRLYPKVDELFKKLTGGISISQAFSAAMEALGRVLDYIWKIIGDYLVAAVEGFGDALVWVIDRIIDFVDWLTKIAEHPVVQWFIDKLAKGVDIAKTAFDEVLPPIEEASTALENAGKVSTEVKAPLEGVGTAVEGSGKKALQFGADVKTGMETAAQAVNINTLKIVNDAVTAATGWEEAAGRIKSALTSCASGTCGFGGGGGGGTGAKPNQYGGFGDQYEPTGNGCPTSPSGLPYKRNSDNTCSRYYDTAGNYVGEGSIWGGPGGGGGGGGGGGTHGSDVGADYSGPIFGIPPGADPYHTVAQQIGSARYKNGVLFSETIWPQYSGWTRVQHGGKVIAPGMVLFEGSGPEAAFMPKGAQVTPLGPTGGDLIDYRRLAIEIARAIGRPFTLNVNAGAFVGDKTAARQFVRFLDEVRILEDNRKGGTGT